jgi:signal transduction histidine kinase
VTIKGFVGMLNQDLQENRPDRVKSDLSRIENATDKMDALLRDLLELSRIGRVVNPPVEVDTVKLTEEALEMLDGRIRSKNVHVTVSPNLPVIYGDRIRLREVIENLIDNAIKYIGDQTDPQIEIGIRDDENEQVFFVKDNGMGVDPRYHDRVFSLFEKLNPTSEGTGIGLALVKRIIETHGGRIWLESGGSGKGCTFYFTIPDIGN